MGRPRKVAPQEIVEVVEAPTEAPKAPLTIEEMRVRIQERFPAAKTKEYPDSVVLEVYCAHFEE